MTALNARRYRRWVLVVAGIYCSPLSQLPAQTTRPSLDVAVGGTVGRGGDYTDRSAFLAGLALAAPSRMGLLGRMSIAVDVAAKPRGDVCRLGSSGRCLPHFPDLRAVTLDARFGRILTRHVKFELFALAGAAAYDQQSSSSKDFGALVLGAGVRALAFESHRLAPLAACREFVAPNTPAGALVTTLCSVGLRLRP